MPRGLRAVMQQLLDEILGIEGSWRIFPEFSESIGVFVEKALVNENSMTNGRYCSQKFGCCRIRAVVLINSSYSVIEDVFV